MLRLTFACLLLVAGTAAHADECDALAVRLSEALGAKKPGRRVGPSIEIRAASGIKIDLTCRVDPIVQSSSSEAQPSAAYFRELTTAAQYVVDDSPGNIEGAITRAYQTSLSSHTKSFIQQNGWSASCYTDPGGSSLRTLCSVGRIPRG